MRQIRLAGSKTADAAADYILGVKLVRGAYVQSENARARAEHRDSPVWSNKAQTDACFDDCSRLVLEDIINALQAGSQPQSSVILATHNPLSVRKALEQLRQSGLAGDEDDHLRIDDRIRSRVVFAQLMGAFTGLRKAEADVSWAPAMADSLTGTLLQLLPKTTGNRFQYPMNSLYVPYGKIDRVLPYLVRRCVRKPQMWFIS